MACASLVSGKFVADIGTDHAYIPLWLVEHGICERAIASDINEGPVKKAAENVAQSSERNRITVVRADGLESDVFSGCDNVVIAGMGGELIVKILEKSPIIRKIGMRLILQPMTKAEHVRAYLWQHGYEILSDKVVLEDGRIYQVIAAQNTGIDTVYTSAQSLVGLRRPEEENYMSLVKHTIDKLRVRMVGKQSAGQDTREEIRLIEELENFL